MTVTVVRPTSDYLVDTWENQASSGSNLYQVLDDDPVNDTTNVAAQGNWPGAQYVAGFGDITVAATQRIKQARIRYRRRSHTNGVTENVYAALIDLVSKKVVSPETGTQPTTTTVAEKTGGWHTAGPDGKEWTQTTANQVGMRLRSIANAWAVVTELYIDFDLRDQAVVSGVTVTGTASTTRPAITWTYTPNADSDAQVRYRVKVFSAAQYGAARFSPEFSPAVWDSGETVGSAASATSGDLTNGTTYKTYVKAGADLNGATWYSSWVASAAFTIAVSPPAAPTLTATADQTIPNIRNLLSVTPGVNLLTANQASVETDTTGLVAITNCSVARSTAQALHGSASLAMTATAGGADMDAGITPSVPVRPGLTYTALASYRAATTGRTVRHAIGWYDASLVYISSSSAGTSADTNSGWVQVVASGVAPAGAAYASMFPAVVTPGAGEVHYVDQISLHGGTGTVWSGGGYNAGANLLTANQASLETNTAGWQAVHANTIIARSTAQAADGSASLSLTSVGAGGMTAATSYGTAGTPVSPNIAYTALSSFRAAATPRTCNLYINWYSASGGFLPNSGPASATDTTSGWTQVSLTATAPATAAYAAVFVEAGSGGASEVHYIDKIALGAGTSTTWTAGGSTSGGTTTVVEYADPVAGLPNLAHPQLASGTDLLGTTEGFYRFVAADTLSSDPSTAYRGQRSLRWDLTTTGSYLDLTYLGGTDFSDQFALPAAAGRTMVLSLYAKASASTAATLGLGGIDGVGGVAVGSASASITIGTTWGRHSVAFTIPTGATWVRPHLTNTSGSASRTVWIDGVQWEVGSTATPLAPGQGQTPTWTAMRGGSAFALDPADPANQTRYLYDEEAPPGWPRLYRARNTTTQSGGLTSADTYAASTLDAPAVWVLKDPLDASRAMELFVLELAEQVAEDATDYHPLGRTRPVVLSDWIGGTDGSLTVLTLGDLQWQQLETLVRAQRTLLLFPPDGGHRYIRFRERSWPRAGSSGGWQRQVALPFLEVDPP